MRDLAFADELQKPALNPFYAIHIALDDAVSAWTGFGELQFGGRVYQGTGSFGSISTIGEGGDGSAMGIQASLSGIDAGFGDLILSQAYRGKAFSLYVGAVDATFTTVTAEPKLIWKGFVDRVELTDGEQLAVTVFAESRLRDQGRPRIKRYTDTEQQRRYPGDLFFEYTAQLVEIPVQWGRSG